MQADPSIEPACRKLFFLEILDYLAVYRRFHFITNADLA
jgi:hypothetical protein